MGWLSVPTISPVMRFTRYATTFVVPISTATPSRFPVVSPGSILISSSLLKSVTVASHELSLMALGSS